MQPSNALLRTIGNAIRENALESNCQMAPVRSARSQFGKCATNGKQNESSGLVTSASPADWRFREPHHVQGAPPAFEWRLANRLR
jgi:hypothetical protein